MIRCRFCNKPYVTLAAIKKHMASKHNYTPTLFEAEENMDTPAPTEPDIRQFIAYYKNVFNSGARLTQKGQAQYEADLIALISQIVNSVIGADEGTPDNPAVYLYGMPRGGLAHRNVLRKQQRATAQRLLGRETSE